MRIDGSPWSSTAGPGGLHVSMSMAQAASMPHHTDIRAGDEASCVSGILTIRPTAPGPEDGLLVLFGMIAEHLFKEAWWREHHEWLGEEYPHGELTKDASTAPNPRGRP